MCMFLIPNSFKEPMSASRPIFVPLSAVAAASSFPKQSSGLPLLSGLDLMAGSFEMTFGGVKY